MARLGIHVVFGGGKIGLMGELATGVLQAGGQITGIMPDFLVARERAHPGLTELIQVQDMAERKVRMAELSEGFLTLPGGLGTLDELFEMLTWRQIGLHQKPCYILNTVGYFDALLEFIRQGEESGLIVPLKKNLRVFETPLQLLENLR